MKVQIGSLTITVETMEELDQLVERYGHTTRLTSEFKSETQHLRECAEVEQRKKPKPQPESPLTVRCNQLRDQHGPVYVIVPSHPVQVGQVIPWGKDNKQKVEILEPAELPGEDGSITKGAWFAKLVDV